MRTRKIYYLSTSVPTYMLRHSLYNAGARWDARAKRWWAEGLPVIRRAADLVGGDAKPEKAYVQRLPAVHGSKGGRPRRSRRDGSQPQDHTGSGGQSHGTQVQVQETGNGNQPQLGVAPGTKPFVRKDQRGSDRRLSGDRRRNERRNEGTRPDGVLVVPMVAAE